MPWRGTALAITECGLEGDEAKTITRAEYVQRRKDWGPQRTSMFTCMTCSQTSDRWHTWDEDPRAAMGREIEWERGSAYWRARTDRGCLLKDELVAIAALIEAHRVEFDASVEAIVARRDWLQKKAEREHRPVAKGRPL